MPSPIKISFNAPFGGFAPGWWDSSYPSFGNPNQAGDMLNADLMNPNYLTQGPGLADLTAGTDSGAVTTLIKSILKTPPTSDKTYGIGGNLLHEISSTAVTNTGDFPHTIDKAAVTGEAGEDVQYFAGNIYYTYNHSGSGGDIGKYDLASTFDDDWGSTVPATGAAALQNAPHQMAPRASILYIANGRYIASYDSVTDVMDATAFTFPLNSVATSIVFNNDRIISAVNNPNLGGNNKGEGVIYFWDTVSSQWDSNPIPVKGTLGGMFVKNGATFVFYQDISDTGGFKLAVINGAQLTDLSNFKGALPAYYQIEEYKNHIVWDGSGKMYAFGARVNNIPANGFQFADSGHATVGAVASPFGTLMVASTDGASAFRLAKFSGYDVTSEYKTLMIEVADGLNTFQLDRIIAFTEQMSTGASCAVTLESNSGAVSLALTAISDITLTRHILSGETLPTVENFRLKFDFAAGSTTNPVKIKRIDVHGHFVTNK